MSEGNCYFCNKIHWTERMTICLDCLREAQGYKDADFIFIMKGEYHSIFTGSDIKMNLNLLEKIIIPNLKRKLEEKEKQKKLIEKQKKEKKSKEVKK